MGRWLSLWSVSSLVLLSFISPAAGKTPIADSDVIRLKGAFLYKFAHFVTWPDSTFADSAAPIVIGILGEDPFGSFLDRAVAQRRAQERPLRIRRFAKIQNIETCHILFVSSSQASRLDKIVEFLKDRSILTVADFADFARRGGAVEFALLEDHMELRVNIDVVARAQLALSSRRLKLVYIVKDEGNKE